MQKAIKELVHLAMQNDQSAINELYQQTYNGVYRTVKTMIKDDDTALDIVQDSFVKAFQNLDQLLVPEKFPSWINQIAANKARDYLKKKRPILFSEMENDDGDMAPLADDCFDHLPEEVLDRAETAYLVKDILDSLPEEQRAVIFMLYYEQMSVKEIAAALDCSENTVKSRLKYGRDKVKIKVEELEKKGTKLYSMAPIPFFLWLLRMAKSQGLTAAALCPTAETVIKSASIASATHGAQTAAVKTAAGTAKAAAKTAAKVGAKGLAKKIIAGAVAVSIAGGSGAVAYRALHKTEAPPVQSVIYNSEQNIAAHEIYEEFLDRYRIILEEDSMTAHSEVIQYYDEICDSLILQSNNTVPTVPNVRDTIKWDYDHPPISEEISHVWELEYITGEGFQEGIPVPNSRYDDNMDKILAINGLSQSGEDEFRYAYYDANGDGVDEMFIGHFWFDELSPSGSLDVYTVVDGTMFHGVAHNNSTIEESDTWILTPHTSEHFRDTYLILISTGTDVFTPNWEINNPIFEWKIFCNSSGEKPENRPVSLPAPEPTPASEPEEPPTPEQVNAAIGETVSFGTFGTYTVENGRVMDDEGAIVEWIVLDTDGSKALLLSKYAYSLGVPYHTEYTEVTWEESVIREYLNGEFMSVFSPEEQAQILPSIVTGDKDPAYGIGTGNDTQDQVFLLSIDEVDKYLTNTEQRIPEQKSLLGHSSGVFTVRQTGFDGGHSWWLRTLGSSGEKAAFVDENGLINREGTPVNEPIDVRPAMWVDLSALDGASAENSDSEKGAYELYAQLLHDIENEYGTWSLGSIDVQGAENYRSIRNGLYYAELIDFDGNGQEELVVSYSGQVGTTEVWTVQDGTLIRLYGGYLGVSGGDFAAGGFKIVEYNGEYFIEDGMGGYEEDYQYYGLLDGLFGIQHTYQHLDRSNEWHTIFDGTELAEATNPMKTYRYYKTTGMYDENGTFSLFGEEEQDPTKMLERTKEILNY